MNDWMLGAAWALAWVMIAAGYHLKYRRAQRRADKLPEIEARVDAALEEVRKVQTEYGATLIDSVSTPLVWWQGDGQTHMAAFSKVLQQFVIEQLKRGGVPVKSVGARYQFGTVRVQWELADGLRPFCELTLNALDDSQQPPIKPAHDPIEVLVQRADDAFARSEE